LSSAGLPVRRPAMAIEFASEQVAIPAAGLKIARA